MVTTVPDSNNPIQIEIFPQRLLNPETVQELIIELQGIEGIMRAILHGPRIASTVPSGPAKGTPNPHEARKSITFAGEEIELGVQVGRIWLELEDEDVIDHIKAACERVLPCGFQINQGLYIRTRPTQTDYAKWGVIKDKNVIGMVDPKSKTQICSCYPFKR